MSKVKKVAATLAVKRTEEKLSALAGMVTVSLDELAESYTTSEELKTVRFHFHTPPMSVDLGKLDFMKGLSSEEAEYVKKNASSFKIFCFPEEAKSIKSICQSIRNYLKELTVGNSDYMTAEDFYNDFLPYLSRRSKDLEKVKMRISDKYEESLVSFSENVMNVVSSVCPERTGTARSAVSFITGRDKEAFLDSISFDLETGFREELASSQKLSELLRRSKEAFVMREIEGIYVGQLQDLWDAICHYVTIIKSAPDSLAGYKITRKGLREAAEKVERGNVGEIPVITNLATQMIDLEKEENRDLANTRAFYIMAEIFGKGSEFGASFKFSEDLPEWVVGEELMDTYRS